MIRMRCSPRWRLPPQERSGRDSQIIPRLRAQRRTALGSELVIASRALRGAESERLLQALREDPAVRYAQIDHRMYPVQGLPDDPRLLDLQWDMLETIGGIHAPKAWQDSAGEGIVVAVLDTGCFSIATSPQIWLPATT